MLLSFTMLMLNTPTMVRLVSGVTRHHHRYFSTQANVWCLCWMKSLKPAPPVGLNLVRRWSRVRISLCSLHTGNEHRHRRRDRRGGGVGNREMTMTMMTSLMMMIGGKLCQSRDSFDRLGQYLSLSAFTDS